MSFKKGFKRIYYTLELLEVIVAVVVFSSSEEYDPASSSSAALGL